MQNCKIINGEKQELVQWKDRKMEENMKRG